MEITQDELRKKIQNGEKLLTFMQNGVGHVK